MIPIKSPEEIAIMAKAGQIAANIREKLATLAQPGVTTLELDQKAAALMQSAGVTPSFLGFDGYQHNIVTCINEEVVHGIPSNRPLKTGDLLTIDLGAKFKNFHSDTAVTIEINPPTSSDHSNLATSQEKAKFLTVGQEALAKAIQKAQAGNYVGDLSHAMQKIIEQSGFNVVRAFVGHGVGTKLHEPPQIPCFGTPKTGVQLKEGIVIAIEVMYTAGSYRVEILKDGWTTITSDRSLAAMFEHTVAITNSEPRILTQA